MKNDGMIGVLILVGISFATVLRGLTLDRPTSSKSGYDTYVTLRSSALRTKRKDVGLPPASAANEPWGAIMDWGMDNGVATVVAFSDGNASIYLSSGGGSIGGGQSHETIRRAAKEMVAAAMDCFPKTHPTTAYPLPQKGEVIFYLLTDEGVFTVSVPEAEVRSDRHPLPKLGEAAQNVITQYRLSGGSHK